MGFRCLRAASRVPTITPGVRNSTRNSQENGPCGAGRWARRTSGTVAAPAANGKLEIFSEQQNLRASFDVAGLGEARRTGTWTDYPVGVAQELIRAGFPVEPAAMLIRSTVPEGSGLSSSAALEVSSALALLHGRSMPPIELARLCQRAEVQFVGMAAYVMVCICLFFMSRSNLKASEPGRQIG